MLKVYSAANLPDAHLLRGLLAQSGIDARVFNENAQGGMGEIPFTHAYPEVWLVNPADLARARAIIGQFECPQASAAEIRCPGCAEENPANFQVCWSCGAAL